MPTLAQAEAALVGPAPAAGAGMVGVFLASVKFVATGASPVAALAPAIAQALLACGVTPDDVTAPADADLGRLAAADWPKFLDIAALVLLESAAFGFAGGGRAQQWEDYRVERHVLADFTKLLADRRDMVKRLWGYGGAKLFPGTVRVVPRSGCSEF